MHECERVIEPPIRRVEPSGVGRDHKPDGRESGEHRAEPATRCQTANDTVREDDQEHEDTRHQHRPRAPGRRRGCGARRKPSVLRIEESELGVRAEKIAERNSPHEQECPPNQVLRPLQGDDDADQDSRRAARHVQHEVGERAARRIRPDLENKHERDEGHKEYRPQGRTPTAPNSARLCRFAFTAIPNLDPCPFRER